MASEGVGELKDGVETRNEVYLEEACMNRPGGSLLCDVGAGRAKGVDKKPTDQKLFGFENSMHRGQHF